MAEAEQEFSHYSARAAAAMQAGSRVFTLALPRSSNRPWITAQSEREARQAAAKLCQRQGLCVADVWFEDGEHPDWGMYRRWYVIAGKVH
jgi:hypothetical protein